VGANGGQALLGPALHAAPTADKLANAVARPEQGMLPGGAVPYGNVPSYCRASRYRSGACRSAARRSDCRARRTFRWEHRPDCGNT
jgi:hypothetical protein